MINLDKYIDEFNRIVCYDLETINDFNIKKQEYREKEDNCRNKVKLLSFSFIIIDFEKNKKVTRNYFFKLKNWDEYTFNEQETLRFHKIHNQKEIDEHNAQDFDWREEVEATGLFVKLINLMFKDEGYVLTGYNIENYDNFILNERLKKYFCEEDEITDFKSDEILDNTFDLLAWCSWMYKIKPKYVSFSDYFFIPSGNNLSNRYFHVFKEHFKAHISIADVEATIKLLLHYKMKYLEDMIQFRNEFVNSCNFKEINLEEIEG
jgi:hypothetical protein